MPHIPYRLQRAEEHEVRLAAAAAALPAGSASEGRVCQEAVGEARSTFLLVSRHLRSDTVQVVEQASRLLSGGETLPVWLLVLGDYFFSGHVASSFAVHNLLTLQRRCRPQSRYLVTGCTEESTLAGYDSVSALSSGVMHVSLQRDSQTTDVLSRVKTDASTQSSSLCNHLLTNLNLSCSTNTLKNDKEPIQSTK